MNTLTGDRYRLGNKVVRRVGASLKGPGTGRKLANLASPSGRSSI
jgi:hypothetical protein